MAILMDKVLGVLLAGGAGERLYPLTRHRAKPAVFYGGVYRIIDVTLSNCVNSGMRKIFILTQYKSLSLNRHIRHGWFHVLAADLGEFIEIIPPQKRVTEHWYIGTADAVWQNLYSIMAVDDASFVLILSGDHIYKMNYYRMVKEHVDMQADVTIGVIEVPVENSSRFGVLQIDDSGRVRGFQEKPETTDYRARRPGLVYGSMGIYVFNKTLLAQLVEEDAANPESSHDFGKDIFPQLLDRYNVCAHHFIDENKKESQYWMDVGTIDAYYEANMDLIAVTPSFNLYDRHWPIRTYQQQYPPAKFVFAQKDQRMGIALDSIVSAGCIISGGRVVNSVLSSGVRINSFSQVEECILFPHVDIGRHCRVRNAIIDRGVHLQEGTVVGFNAEEDQARYHLSEEGIVVISPEGPSPSDISGFYLNRAAT
jgi:glucose-1-phosphate adenylyltransferase